MVNEDECLAAGVDIKKIQSLDRRLRKIGREMGDLGIILFGGSGSGSLRSADQAGEGRLILADVAPNGFDGGDGGRYYDSSGLERGE